MPHLKRVKLCYKFFMKKNKYFKLILHTIKAINFCHEKKFSNGERICTESIFSNVKKISLLNN